MITIKNNLNQPVSIGDEQIAADGTMDVTAVTPEIQRLADKGILVVVQEPEPPKPADPPRPPVNNAGTDGKKKGDEK